MRQMGLLKVQLRDPAIERPNRVWPVDLCHIPMLNGTSRLLPLPKISREYPSMYGETASCNPEDRS